MQGTLSSDGELLEGSFLTQLTLTQSNTKNSNFYNMGLSNRMGMSPIAEMNSSKDSSYSRYDDDRKLTGTGQYNLSQVGDQSPEDYSDDFESVSSGLCDSVQEDDETQVSTGGTANAKLANKRASENRRELDQVIQSYRQALEMTSSSAGFQQYHTSFGTSKSFQQPTHYPTQM